MFFSSFIPAYCKLIDSSSFAGSRYDKQDWRRLRHTRLQGFQQKTGFSLRIFFSFFLLQDFCFVIKEKTREMDTETHFKVFSPLFLLLSPFFSIQNKNTERSLECWNEWFGRTHSGCSARTTKDVFQQMRWSLCSSICQERWPAFNANFVCWSGWSWWWQYPGVLQPIF